MSRPLTPVSLGAYLRHLRVPVLLLALGCNSASPEEQSVTCPQTYEFGNTGCIRLAGQVVDSSGQPVQGAVVGPRYLPPPGTSLNIVYATTGSDGRWFLQLTRFDGPPHASPDTVSLYVQAVLVDTIVHARDSTLVTATVTPVGSIPDTTFVTLHLAL
jgi:hypothetical protein